MKRPLKDAVRRLALSLYVDLTRGFPRCSERMHRTQFRNLFQAGIAAKLRSVPAENRVNDALEKPRKTFDMAKAETTGLRNRPETDKPRAKKNRAYRARLLLLDHMRYITPGEANLFCFCLETQTQSRCMVTAYFSKMRSEFVEQDEKSEKTRRKTKSDAAIGGMVATFALLFLAVFVGLFIWLAA